MKKVRTQTKRVLSVLMAVIMVALAVPVMEASAVSGGEIVGYARQYLGYPYVWGTAGPNTFDCSGLVKYVFGHFGINLPHGTSYIWDNPTAYGDIIAYGNTSSAMPGDLISWPGHIAIYSGNGNSIEALNADAGVVEIKVNSHVFDYDASNYRVIRVYGVDSGNNPIGVVNDCSGGNGCVYIKGWVFDKDEISESSYIHVYIGGNVSSGEGHAFLANKSRKDVDGTYHCGEFHGFEETIETGLTGSQKVYIYGINVGGGENVLLGEYIVTIGQGFDPYGNVDVCSGGNGYIWIKGWVFDRDKITESSYIHVYIGEGDAREGYAFLANVSRKDVDNAHHCGEFHGFEETVFTQLRGEQRVCIWGINVGGGVNKLLHDGRVNISSHTHSYTSSVTKAATCSTTGIETFTCSCGDSYTKPIAVNPNNHINTTNVAATASTCTVKGYSAGVYCNDCKKYISGHAEQPLAAHQTTLINAKAASYDADGYTGDTYCTVCKQTLSYGTAIPKLTKPEDPTNPTAQQQQQSGACPYCGQSHTGLFGTIIGLFHRILALFGLKK